MLGPMKRSKKCWISSMLKAGRIRRASASADQGEREWFQLMATATAAALREGRGSVVSSNVPEILDCCKRLAAHLGASTELIERGELIDVTFKARPAAKVRAREFSYMALITRESREVCNEASCD
jgi:hypothetical protein